MEDNIKFCSICMKDVHFKKVVREEDVEVRGVTVHVCLTYLVDPEGHELYDYDTETANSEIVDRAYRKTIGLLTDEEIREIRTKYYLSAELFGKALGMGSKSITRLENAYVQSRETNSLLYLVQKPENFLEVIELNKTKLTESEYRKCLNGCCEAKPVFFLESYSIPDIYGLFAKLTKNHLHKTSLKNTGWDFDGQNVCSYYGRAFNNKQTEGINRA